VLLDDRPSKDSHAGPRSRGTGAAPIAGGDGLLRSREGVGTTAKNRTDADMGRYVKGTARRLNRPASRSRVLSRR
jgi:hypothetical protein